MTSWNRTARDSARTQGDSSPHVRVGVCWVCAGHGKVLLVCGRSNQRRTALWAKAHGILTREMAEKEETGTRSTWGPAAPELPAWRLGHTPTLTHGLEVECHHLAANIPEHLGLVVGGVHPGAFGVNAAHLPLVVSTGSIGNKS